MTDVGKAYGGALFELCAEDNCEQEVLQQTKALQDIFLQSPNWLRLLSAPTINKPERIGLIDEALQGKVHPYLLNFFKILCEHGYIQHFDDCCKEFLNRYYIKNNIALAKVESAVELTSQQQTLLCEKLAKVCGKTIVLQCTINPQLLGGMCVKLDDKQFDGTVKSRLQKIKSDISNTVLA